MFITFDPAVLRERYALLGDAGVVDPDEDGEVMTLEAIIVTFVSVTIG